MTQKDVELERIVPLASVKRKDGEGGPRGLTGCRIRELGATGPRPWTRAFSVCEKGKKLAA